MQLPSLCEKCLYSELFWSAFPRIRTEYEDGSEYRDVFKTWLNIYDGSFYENSQRFMFDWVLNTSLNTHHKKLIKTLSLNFGLCNRGCQAH